MCEWLINVIASFSIFLFLCFFFFSCLCLSFFVVVLLSRIFLSSSARLSRNRDGNLANSNVNQDHIASWSFRLDRCSDTTWNVQVQKGDVQFATRECVLCDVWMVHRRGYRSLHYDAWWDTPSTAAYAAECRICNQGVMVIDNREPYALTRHRDKWTRNRTCGPLSVSIDGEHLTRLDLVQWTCEQVSKWEIYIYRAAKSYCMGNDGRWSRLQHSRFTTQLNYIWNWISIFSGKNTSGSLLPFSLSNYWVAAVRFSILHLFVVYSRSYRMRKKVNTREWFNGLFSRWK